MSVKGRGTVAYIDTDNDDQYVIMPCVKNLKLSGKERGVIESEPCLSDTEVSQDTGDLKRGTITGTMEWDVNEAALANAMDTAIDNNTTIQFAVKIPKATPVYAFYEGKLSRLEPQAIERDRTISRDFEFLPMAAPTFSTTAPTLEA